MRTRIGMVFQHFALWPHLTVLQNVIEAPMHVQRRPKAEVRDEARALLATVGLLDKRDAFPARLSGGQKQRVGIARALAMQPGRCCCSTSRPARSIPSWSARCWR